MADGEKKSFLDRIRSGAKGLFNKAKKGLGLTKKKQVDDKNTKQETEEISNKDETKTELYDAIEMACESDSCRDLIKAKIDDILDRYDENDEFTALDILNHAKTEFEEMADKKKKEGKKGSWFGDLISAVTPDAVGSAIDGAKSLFKGKGKKKAATKNAPKDKKKKLYEAIDAACDFESDRDMMKSKIDEILEEYDENAEFTAFDVLNDAQEHFEEMGLGIGAGMKLAKFALKYPLLQIKILKIIQKAGKGDMAGAAKEVLALVEKEAKNLGIDMKEVKKKFKTQFLPLMEKAAKAANVKIPKEIKDALTSVQASTINDLDDLLSGDEELEEEYDEEEPVTNIVTEKTKISDLVRKTSVDSAAFSKDMRHLIQFKNSSLPLNEQLMKGRPKYLKAIKSYVKGDKNAEVKMSWREGSKLVKIADLKPKIESLKALLRSSPGELRVVQCL
jgi:vacuolar-type H+-ATPase subunit H